MKGNEGTVDLLARRKERSQQAKEIEEGFLPVVILGLQAGY